MEHNVARAGLGLFLAASTASTLHAFQAFSGSLEWLMRRNAWTAGGLPAGDIREFESMLMLRAKSRVAVGSGTLSGAVQAYGVLAGDRSPGLLFDEAYANISMANGWSVAGVSAGLKEQHFRRF